MEACVLDVDLVFELQRLQEELLALLELLLDEVLQPVMPHWCASQGDASASWPAQRAYVMPDEGEGRGGWTRQRRAR